MADIDELIARLRTRAADPDRRVDVRRSAFDPRTATLDLGALMGELQSTRGDLAALLDGIRAGALPPAPVASAEAIGTAMADTTTLALPSPADDAAIAAAENRLGFGLPADLRRIYIEVADGGFGPGTGLASLETSTDRYLELRTGDELPRGRSWPVGLLPVVVDDPSIVAVDTTGPEVPVIEWDPDGLSERASAAAWERSFRSVATSMVAWLDAWLAGPSPASRADAFADQILASRVQAAREARASFAAKTPEERAAYGLPEVGWERVVWGGLGLDDE
jgi:hypothetical protein